MKMIWLCALLFNIVRCDIFNNPPKLVQENDPRFGPPDSEPQSYLAHGVKPRSHGTTPSRDVPQSYFPYGVPLGSPRDGNPPDFNEFSRAEPYELYDLEEKLTRTGKWPEFLRKLKEQGDKTKDGKITPNWQQEVYKWAAYAKHLNEDTVSTTTLRPLLRIAEPKGKPHVGMEMYWSGESNENKKAPQQKTQQSAPKNVSPKTMSGANMLDLALKKHLDKDEINNALRNAAPNEPPPGFSYPSDANIPPPDPHPGLSPPQIPSPNLPSKPVPQNNDLMRMMLIKIQGLENLIKEQSKTQSPRYLPGFPSEQRNLKRENVTASKSEDFKNLPVVDDFNSPIRWVRLTSNETEDGLARVTDPETGKNRQFMVNGIYYVPISDYRGERIGLTSSSTTLAPLLTTEKSILRTVMNNMDQKKPDERDWLAIEVLMGGSDRNELMCEGEKCQARCRTMGCESMCDGDSCAAGCIGPACTAHCTGPGCLSMCIGERCTARCEGLSCDSRCRGKNCEANCHKFSCYMTVNGAFSRGAGFFNQWYPQEDE